MTTEPRPPLTLASCLRCKAGVIVGADPRVLYDPTWEERQRAWVEVLGIGFRPGGPGFHPCVPTPGQLERVDPSIGVNAAKYSKEYSGA